MYTYDRAFKIMHIEYKDKIGVNLGEKQIFTGVHCFYGNRRVPQYLLRLMAYKIQMEKLADKRNKDDKEDDVTNK